VEAVHKLVDYMRQEVRNKTLPLIEISRSQNPQEIGNELIRRMNMQTDTHSLILTIHLFTEHWLNQILLKFCPSHKLTDHLEYEQKLRVCYAIGKLTEEIFFNLQKFNELRNKISHRIDYNLEGMFLGYKGCRPHFELTKYKPSLKASAGTHHIMNVLGVVMEVTYGKLHNHCFYELGFKDISNGKGAIIGKDKPIPNP
jgi:hypothetical protein